MERNKNVKRLIALLLSACLLVGGFPVAALGEGEFDFSPELEQPAGEEWAADELALVEADAVMPQEVTEPTEEPSESPEPSAEPEPSAAPAAPGTPQYLHTAEIVLNATPAEGLTGEELEAFHPAGSASVGRYLPAAPADGQESWRQILTVTVTPPQLELSGLELAFPQEWVAATGADAGSFLIENNGQSLRLAQDAACFAWAEAAEAGSVLLFQKTEEPEEAATEATPLPGYARTTVAPQPGTPVLVAALRQGQLYLLDPAEGYAAVRVISEITAELNSLPEEIPEELEGFLYKNEALRLTVCGVECALTLVGLPAPATLDEPPQGEQPVAIEVDCSFDTPARVEMGYLEGNSDPVVWGGGKPDGLSVVVKKLAPAPASNTAALEKCLYTFRGTAQDGFAISADNTAKPGETVYLDLYSYRMDGGNLQYTQGFLSKSAAAIIHISQDAGPEGSLEKIYGGGSFVLSQTIDANYYESNKNYPPCTQNASPHAHTLAYSIWGFFTDSCNGAPDAAAKIHLFRYENGSYTRIWQTSEIVSGGQYLIAATADNGKTYRVLRPYKAATADGKDRNQNKKDFIASAGTVLGGRTDVLLYGLQAEAAAAGVRINDQSYTVTLTQSYQITQKVAADSTKVFLAAGDEILYERVPGYYGTTPEAAAPGADAAAQSEPESLVQWGDNAGNAYAEVTLKGTVKQESFANRHGGGSNGKPSGYNGAEIPLSDCLYDITKNTDGTYTVSRQHGTETVYVSAGFDTNDVRGPGQLEKADLEIAQLREGIFTLQEVNGAGRRYLAFRRNGWGVFFTKSNPLNTAVDNKGNVTETEQDCEFRIYRRDPSGAGSTELPGYVRCIRLEEIVPDGQYLLVAQYYCETDVPKSNDLYVVAPSVQQNRNSHCVKANHISLNGYTDVKIKAKSPTPANTPATLRLKSNGTGTADGPTYSITVVRAPKAEDCTDKAVEGNEGQALGKPISKVTFSTGNTYKIKTPAGVKVKYWISADNGMVTVEAASSEANEVTLRAFSTMGGFFGRTYVAYVDDQGGYHAVELVVINTAATANVQTCDFYVKDLHNSDAWYIWCEKGKVNYTANDFKQVQPHEVLHISVDSGSGFGINFFARAHENYVLTQLGATGSAGDYKSIVCNEGNTKPVSRAEETAFFTNGPTSQHGRFGVDSIKAMIQFAMDELKCTGAMGFSQAAQSMLSFESDSLPTITKKVLAIDRKNNGGLTGYADGATVTAGDIVHFMVTIKVLPREAGRDINFTNVTVKDLLPNAIFAGYSATAANETVENRYVFRNTATTSEDEEPAAKDGYNIPTSESDKAHWLSVTSNSEGMHTIDITGLLNEERFKQHGGEIKLYINYVVTAADETNVAHGKNLENNAELVCSYTSNFDNGAGKTRNAFARAILTVGMSNRLQYINLGLNSNFSTYVYILPVENSDSYYAAWDASANDFSLVFEVDVLGHNGQRTRVKRSCIKFAKGEAVTVNNTAGRRFAVELAPQYITAEIQVYIQDKNEGRVTDIRTFTIQQYVQAVLNDLDRADGKSQLVAKWQVNEKQSVAAAHEKKDQLKKMLEEMLRYGAAVQKYLGYAKNDCNCSSEYLKACSYQRGSCTCVANGDGGQTGCGGADGVCRCNKNNANCGCLVSVPCRKSPLADSILPVAQRGYTEARKTEINEILTAATGSGFYSDGKPYRITYTPATGANGSPDAGITFTGLALQLDPDSIGIRIYFTYDDLKFNFSQLKANYDYVHQWRNGTMYQYSYRQEVHAAEEGCYVLVSNISSNWLANTYRVTIATGVNAQRRASIELSAMAYVWLLLQSADGSGNAMNEQLVELGCAMYAYSTAAQAYFGSQQA